jgi:hypothetical protein
MMSGRCVENEEPVARIADGLFAFQHPDPSGRPLVLLPIMIAPQPMPAIRQARWSTVTLCRGRSLNDDRWSPIYPPTHPAFRGSQLELSMDASDRGFTDPARGHRLSEGNDARYLLRFDSLFVEGRDLVFPCDAAGQVDLSGLSVRARDNYLRAQRVVGREYATPWVLREARMPRGS